MPKAKISCVHDPGAKVKEQIVSYLPCERCLAEKPLDQSPMMWARLNVGITHRGHIQIWCVRHNCNVDVMRFITDELDPHLDLA